MTAAEVLAQHRKSWNVQSGVATCTAPGCDWGRFGTLTQTDVPFAAHQLDALRAAGYEIVERKQQPDMPPGPMWSEGMVLSWSGKWHIPLLVPTDASREPRTVCGGNGYTQVGLPKDVRRLADIASGAKRAPVCKLCRRSVDKAQ